MVVPEERHLLLQRALRVHHPEQPALAGVEDIGRWLKAVAAASGHADVARTADERIDIIGDVRVVQQAGDGGGVARKREIGVGVDFLLARAESCPPVEMIDLLLATAAHAALLQGPVGDQILRPRLSRVKRRVPQPTRTPPTWPSVESVARVAPATSVTSVELDLQIRTPTATPPR